MPLIVVREDDAGTRMLVTSVLKKDGHEMLTAENGAQGLQLVEQHRPALVISDVQMPEMNGFQMLAAVRQHPALASTPVILLTSLQERADMRLGMNTGAGDHITKPFHPAELREAAAAQLNKRVVQASLQNMAVDAAVQAALDVQKHKLAQLYERRLAKELSDGWSSGDGSDGDEKFAQASVLYVDMPSYAALAERLASSELSELVRKFYGSAGDTVHLFGARHMQFIGEGLLSVFTDSTDTRSVNHGLRAVRAVLGLVDSAHRMRHFLQTQFAGRALPRFAINVALHSGPVTLSRLVDPLHATPARTLPVGDAVSATLLLQKQAPAPGLDHCGQREPAARRDRCRQDRRSGARGAAGPHGARGCDRAAGPGPVMRRAPSMRLVPLGRLLAASLLLLALVPALLVAGVMARGSSQAVEELAGGILFNVAARVQSGMQAHLAQAHNLLNGLFPEPMDPEQKQRARDWLRHPESFEAWPLR